jgi:hypothetical protein
MPDLIYVATFVFTLMSTGLIFTAIEFRKLQEEESETKKE